MSDLAFDHQLAAFCSMTGLTCARLAQALGTNAGTVGEWKQGETLPTSEQAGRIVELVLQEDRPGDGIPLLIALAWNPGIERALKCRILAALYQLEREAGARESWQAIALKGGSDAHLRWRAAAALIELCQQQQAARTLLSIVHDSTLGPVPRSGAARVLECLGRVDEAIEARLALARSRSIPAALRVRAASRLADLGRTGEMVPILRQIAQDPTIDDEACEEAANELGRAGLSAEAVPILVAIAHRAEADASTRQSAAEALSTLGYTIEAGRAWLELGQGENVQVMIRILSIDELADKHLEETAPALWELARDETVDAAVRLAAAEAAQHLGEVVPSSFLRAIAGNVSLDMDVRRRAVWALRAFGRMPSLCSLAQSEVLDASLRLAAADALIDLGQTAEALLVVFVLGADAETDASVRMDAARILQEQNRVQEATVVLTSLAKEKDARWWMPERIGKTLSDLGQFAALHAMADNTQATPQMRIAAVRALVKAGRADGYQQPMLAMASDKAIAPEARAQAAEALGEMGQVDQAAALLLLLADDIAASVWLVGKITAALGILGRNRDLLSLVQDETRTAEFRLAAAKAISDPRLAGRAAETLAMLTIDTRLKVPDRVASMALLSRINWPAPVVLAALELVAWDRGEEWFLTSRAEWTFWRLKGVCRRG